jgi:hypothetical protein
MESKVYKNCEENIASNDDSKNIIKHTYFKELDDDFSEQSSIISNIDVKEPERTSDNYCIVEEAKNKSETEGKSNLTIYLFKHFN